MNYRTLFVGLLALFLCTPYAYSSPEDCTTELTNSKIQPDIQSTYSKFKAYFEAVSETTLEREQVVYIAKLAVLAKEHMLLMGPPGTAKSQLAESILKAIKADKGQGPETSYYKIQMTPETTLSETHGPINYNELNQSGRQVRFYDEGMLKSHGVFIDEIFDSRANAKRNILGLINEREHAQGPNIEEGYIHTVIAATNKYLSEVYEEAGNDGPKALVDRFAFSIFIPGGLEFTDSILQIIKSAGKTKTTLPELTYEDINLLREKIEDIEIPDHVALFLELLSRNLKIQTEALEQASLKEYFEKKADGEHPSPPYRATKYHSARTTGKAAGVLKTIVLLDWLESGGTRQLTATLEDIKKLEVFYTLNGPSDEFLDETLSLTTNDHEKRQLMNIKQERKIFRKLFTKFADEVNDNVLQFAINELQEDLVAAASDEHKKAEVLNKLANIIAQSFITPTELKRKNAITSNVIAKILVNNFTAEALEDLLGKEEAQKNLNTLYKELSQIKEQKALENEELQKQLDKKINQLATEYTHQSLKKKYIEELSESEKLTPIDEPYYGPKMTDNHLTAVKNLQHINDDIVFIGTHSKFSNVITSNPSFVYAIDKFEQFIDYAPLNNTLENDQNLSALGINDQGELVSIYGENKKLQFSDLTGNLLKEKDQDLNTDADSTSYAIYEPRHKNVFHYTFSKTDDSFEVIQQNGSKNYFLKSKNSYSFKDYLGSNPAEFIAGDNPNVVYFYNNNIYSIQKMTLANGIYSIESVETGQTQIIMNLKQAEIIDNLFYFITVGASDNPVTFHLKKLDLNTGKIIDSIKITGFKQYIDIHNRPNLWFNPQTGRITFAQFHSLYIYDTNTQKFIIESTNIQKREDTFISDFIEFKPNRLIYFYVNKSTSQLTAIKYHLFDEETIETTFTQEEFETEKEKILQEHQELIKQKATDIINGSLLESEIDYNELHASEAPIEPPNDAQTIESSTTPNTNTTQGTSPLQSSKNAFASYAVQLSPNIGTQQASGQFEYVAVDHSFTINLGLGDKIELDSIFPVNNFKRIALSPMQDRIIYLTKDNKLYESHTTPNSSNGQAWSDLRFVVTTSLSHQNQQKALLNKADSIIEDVYFYNNSYLLFSVYDMATNMYHPLPVRIDEAKNMYFVPSQKNLTQDDIENFNAAYQELLKGRVITSLIESIIIEEFPAVELPLALAK